jgi:NAD(P)-dependent dehydrogenase (short-subunit alcohol dehydrogenase family)
MDVQADGIPNSRAGGRSPEFNPTEDERKVYPPMASGGPPIGRPAHPTEVAAAIAFFASPEASYVTGQLLSVTGGAQML